MSKIKFTEHQKKYINKNAQKWVQVLFDDELLQSTGSLESNQGFCCLGVGALCYQLKTGEDLPVRPNGDYDNCILDNEFGAVRDWLGLKSDWGFLQNSESLASMNDDGKTFKEIAQVILERPEQLFHEVQS